MICIKFNRQFFIAIDGPKNGEDQLAIDVQNYVLELEKDKPSLLLATLIRQTNMGCRLGVSSAITWAFSMTDALIILEDDVDVDERFFRFMDFALARYINDQEIFLINGWSPIINSNMLPNSKPHLFRSAFLFASGWATWSNRWTKVDTELEAFRDDRNISGLSTVKERKFGYFFCRIIRTKLEACIEGLDTWDYQVLYSMWKHGSFSITPTNRLTGNLGFDFRATHTKTAPSQISLDLWELPTTGSNRYESNWKEIEELDVEHSRAHDFAIGENIFGVYSGRSLIRNLFTLLLLVKKRMSIYFTHSLN